MGNNTVSLKQIEHDVNVTLSILEDLKTKTKRVGKHIYTLRQQINELKIAQNSAPSNNHMIKEGCINTLKNIMQKLPNSIQNKIQSETELAYH